MRDSFFSAMRKVEVRRVWDADEKYVTGRCAEWVARVLGKRPRIEVQTVQVALWLMGKGAPGFERALVAQMSRSRRDRLRRALRAELHDSRGYGQVVIGTIAGMPRRVQEHLALTLAADLEQLASRTGRSGARGLARHLGRVGATFGLSEIEVELAFFLAVLATWSEVDHYFDSHLHCRAREGRSSLLAALGITGGQLAAAKTGRLLLMGMLEPERRGFGICSDFIPLFADSSVDLRRQALFNPPATPTHGLEELVPDAGAREHLRGLLGRPPERPVHILLYGPPGTGKTSTARALAAEFGRPAWEVGVSPGRTVKGRCSALLACLHAAAGTRGSLVIVDDAAALLATDELPVRSGEALERAGLLKLLDETPGPVVWIVNHTGFIDPAVRRRFTYSLEFLPLGPGQRAAVWHCVLRRHRALRCVPAALRPRLASQYVVSPAVIDDAVAQAKARFPKGGGEFMAVLRHALDAKVALIDGERVRVAREPGGLFTEALAMTPGLDEVLRMGRAWMEGMAAGRGDGRPLSLLFSGPPGTGKSHVAMHLALLLGRPAVHRAPSDLLSKWLGDTERNIAAAFHEAEESGAVLVFDEVDTLLQTRQDDQRPHEIARVNEMLEQLEHCRGIVIGTTNRLGGIDEAARRRFRVKVAFSALSGERTLALYQKVMAPLGKGRFDTWSRVSLAGAAELVPADFFLVRDNAQLLGDGPFPHVELVTRLLAERDARRGVYGGARRPVGFRLSGEPGQR